MDIAVLGAGVSGLTAARRSVKYTFEELIILFPPVFELFYYFRQWGRIIQ